MKKRSICLSALLVLSLLLGIFATKVPARAEEEGEEQEQQSYNITVPDGFTALVDMQSATAYHEGDRIYIEVPNDIPKGKYATNWSVQGDEPVEMDGTWGTGIVFYMPASDVTVTCDLEDLAGNVTQRFFWVSFKDTDELEKGSETALWYTMDALNKETGATITGANFFSYEIEVSLEGATSDGTSLTLTNNFKEGATLCYGFNLVIAEDECAAEITINAAGVLDPEATYSKSFRIIGNTDYSITEQGVEGEESAATPEWSTEEETGLLFVSNADFSKFVGVFVDGTEIDKSNYTAEEGSTRITLTLSYLSTLSEGSHTILIASTDGSATSSFKIMAAVSDESSETSEESSEESSSETSDSSSEAQEESSDSKATSEESSSTPQNSESSKAEETSSNSTTTTSDVPNTGDSSAIASVMICLLVAVAGLAILIQRKRVND